MLKSPRRPNALPARKFKDARQDSERWSNQSLPDYIVNMTRNSLLTFTTSLANVSTEVHDFFAKLNTILAFERMMRSCAGWMMPAGSAVMPMGMAMTPMGLGMAAARQAPQPLWPVQDWFAQPRRQPQPQIKALPWFGTELLALPKPQPKPAPAPASRCLSDRDQQAPAIMDAAMPVYGAMLALSAALFTLTPVAMQAWNLPV